MRKREVRRLYVEIPDWVRSGTLSEEVAAHLRALYGSRREAGTGTSP